MKSQFRERVRERESRKNTYQIAKKTNPEFIEKLKKLAQVTLFSLALFIPVYISFLLADYTFARETDPSYINKSNTLLEVQEIPSRETSFPPKLVTVDHRIDEHKAIVYGKTVKDALIELGFNDFNNYQIKPSLDTLLTSRTHIVVKDVKTERKVEFEEIPYSSTTVLDDTREIDTTTIIQDGSKGKKKLVVEYNYLDGILQNRKVIREEIVTEPKDQITALGTKRVFREITINGETFEYWKKIRVYATSYDANCKGCNNITATGATLKKGVIAVDPEVIPLYTNMYVPGYGFGQALDVGGAVKGKHIDLGFADLREVQGQWSARYVDIYILD
jgi:3D (Asp-Asp-Asp) domain-containing protein